MSCPPSFLPASLDILFQLSLLESPLNSRVSQGTLRLPHLLPTLALYLFSSSPWLQWHSTCWLISHQDSSSSPHLAHWVQNLISHFSSTNQYKTNTTKTELLISQHNPPQPSQVWKWHIIHVKSTWIMSKTHSEPLSLTPNRQQLLLVLPSKSCRRFNHCYPSQTTIISLLSLLEYPPNCFICSHTWPLCSTRQPVITFKT